MTKHYTTLTSGNSLLHIASVFADSEKKNRRTMIFVFLRHKHDTISETVASRLLM